MENMTRRLTIRVRMEIAVLFNSCICTQAIPAFIILSVTVKQLST